MALTITGTTAVVDCEIIVTEATDYNREGLLDTDYASILLHDNPISGDWTQENQYLHGPWSLAVNIHWNGLYNIEIHTFQIYNTSTPFTLVVGKIYAVYVSSLFYNFFRYIGPTGQSSILANKPTSGSYDHAKWYYVNAPLNSNYIADIRQYSTLFCALTETLDCIELVSPPNTLISHTLNDCVITVTNDTVYYTNAGNEDPLPTQDPTDYAHVLFTQDPVGNVTMIETLGPWTITPGVNGLYGWCLFGVMVYKPYQDFEVTPNILYLYDGKYYYYDGSSYWNPIVHTNLGEYPDTSADWVEVSGQANFYSYNYSQYCESEWITCGTPATTLEVTEGKTECNTYELSANLNTSLVVNLYLLSQFSSYNEIANEFEALTPISSQNWDNTSIPIEVTSTQDGVYVILVLYPSGNSYTIADIFIEIELCDFDACKNTVIKDILCEEFDPCCESCDKSMRLRYDKWSDHLNLMVYFSKTIRNFLAINLKTCLISGSVTDEYDENLQKLAKFIENMNAITDRCGECYGAIETQSTKPCKNC